MLFNTMTPKGRTAHTYKCQEKYYVGCHKNINILYLCTINIHEDVKNFDALHVASTSHNAPRKNNAYSHSAHCQVDIRDAQTIYPKSSHSLYWFVHP